MVDKDHPPYRGSRTYRNQTPMLRDRMNKRAMELLFGEDRTWPDIANIINQEFAAELKGVKVPWQTFYGRHRAALKKNAVIKPMETARHLAGIISRNDRMIKKLMPWADAGHSKAAKAIIDIQDQTIKLQGLYKPEKHQVEKSLVLELEEGEDQQTALDRISQRFKLAQQKAEDHASQNANSPDISGSSDPEKSTT